MASTENTGVRLDVVFTVIRQGVKWGHTKIRYNFYKLQLYYNFHFFYNHSIGGAYIYTEASSRTVNQTARLQSVLVRPTRNTATSCLSFWYHMYGSSIGALNIYIQRGASMGSPLWTRKGTQGNKWINAKITISQTAAYNVRMRHYL